MLPDPQPVDAAPATPHLWRAMVEPNLPLDGVEIHLRRRLDAERVQVVGPLSMQMETHIVEEAVAAATPPMLRLDDEMAGALLRALAAYYGDGHTVHAELGRLAEQVEALAARVMVGAPEVDRG